jgi:hypothetical protein
MPVYKQLQCYWMHGDRQTAATPSCLTSWKMAVTYSSWNMELYSHAYIALARLCFPYSTVLFDQIFKGLLLNYCFSSPCFCRWHRQLELSRMQALQCRQVREHTAYAWALWTLNHDGWWLSELNFVITVAACSVAPIAMLYVSLPRKMAPHRRFRGSSLWHGTCLQNDGSRAHCESQVPHCLFHFFTPQPLRVLLASNSNLWHGTCLGDASVSVLGRLQFVCVGFCNRRSGVLGSCALHHTPRIV